MLHYSDAMLSPERQVKCTLFTLTREHTRLLYYVHLVPVQCAVLIGTQPAATQ
jgi:hypothetical protein